MRNILYIILFYILVLSGCGQSQDKENILSPAKTQEAILSPAKTQETRESEREENSVNPYKDILDLYWQALYEHKTYPEQWDLNKYYEENGLLPIITSPYWWKWEDTDDMLAKEGFAFLDLNGDGIEELVIGWVDTELWSMEEGYIFAVYTVIDDEVILAIEGWERNLYVVGEDTYLYNTGSGGAGYISFEKYKFNLEYKDFLEPVEKIYSQEDAGDHWWEHITNPKDVGVIEYTGKHEDLLIDEDEAWEMGESWMESGITIDYTCFSEYISSQ